jgi:hypothetical protein
MQRGGRQHRDAARVHRERGALDAAGIPVTICTGFEGYVPKSRVLRHEAAMAAAAGMDRERALRAVTINAARLLGIEKEYGSIEVGKAADLVLYDGDPFQTHDAGDPHADAREGSVRPGRAPEVAVRAPGVPAARRRGGRCGLLPGVVTCDAGGENRRRPRTFFAPRRVWCKTTGLAASVLSGRVPAPELNWIEHPPSK